MFITGVGTATPPWRYTQRQCWESAQNSELISRLSPRAQAIIKKVLLGNNGVETRHLALESIEQCFALDPDTLQTRFERHAPRLASAAATAALQQAALRVQDIDALVISTCTGYVCPGLSSYVSEQLGLRPDALLLDLVGQGCGAALPNLRTGEALLAGDRAQHTLSVCVEVCSAAIYLDEDPGVLISACLFGDGAGAAVLSKEPKDRPRRVEWRLARSLLSAADRDYLRFEHRQGMLRNILTKQVPDLASKYAESVLAEALTAAGLSRQQVKTWILHAGGRDILHSLSHRFGLTDEDCRWSSGVLREHGNLSSSCVFFVLNSALQGDAPDGPWWMTSFGAGFSCHGALLQVSGS